MVVPKICLLTLIYSSLTYIKYYYNVLRDEFILILFVCNWQPVTHL